MFRIAPLVVLLLAAGTAPVSADGCPEPLGRWPYGASQAVTVFGGYAHFGGGVALHVADIADAAAPRYVGNVELPDLVTGVATSGNHDFVTVGYAGLWIVDVSTPSSPVKIGSIPTPDHAAGVAIEGAYAYVAAGNGGLRVIDVSTPVNPVEVGFVDTPDLALGVAIAGGYAYVADYDGAFA